jgi:hypothetical protein
MKGYPKFLQSHILEKMIKPLQKELALKRNFIIKNSNLILESIMKEIETVEPDKLPFLIGGFQTLMVLNQEGIKEFKKDALERVNNSLNACFKKADDRSEEEKGDADSFLHDGLRSFLDFTYENGMLTGKRKMSVTEQQDGRSISETNRNSESQASSEMSDTKLIEPVVEFSELAKMSKGEITTFAKFSLTQMLLSPILSVFTGFFLTKHSSSSGVPIMLCMDVDKEESIIMKKGEDGNLLVDIKIPYLIKILNQKIWINKDSETPNPAEKSLRAILNYKVNPSGTENPFELTDLNFVENFESSTLTNPQ